MRNEQAVVIGGSVAGLLAAAAAAPHFERVVVLERDRLEDEPVARKGAPQGNQIHILLPIGERMIAELFPGIHEEFIAAGCTECNEAADLPAITALGWRPRVRLEIADVIAFRRPLLELVIRRRLLALDNVEIRQASVTGLRLQGDGPRLAGVLLDDGEEVDAELVIDAGGRGTKSPKWLRQLGFDVPDEDEVRVYMGYATQFVEVPDGVFEGGAKGFAALPWPGQLAGGVMMPADNGVHVVTAVGMMKDYPPADREGMLEFLERAPSPLVAEAARRSKPVSEVHTYRQPGNLWRHWETLANRPGRFLAVGDAVASFNPVYGQGMTMAALGARLLAASLADGATDLDEVPLAFQRRLAPEVGVAFGMAAGGDAFFEGAELRNFEPPSAEAAAFLERIGELATHDVEVVTALMEAFFYLRPEALESASIAAKVAALEAGGGAAPTAVDPRAFPRTVLPDPAETAA